MDDVMLTGWMLTAGGGELDRLGVEARQAGEDYALLANDRGVCGLVRWDERDGVVYGEEGA